MANFETIRLDKGMYKSGIPLTDQLEELDPSARYKGTEMEHLDAFQRQLKRFDIRVKGEHSDPLEKFFATGDSAALFPEYVARAVQQGMRHQQDLEAILASKTVIHSLDYRSIRIDDSFDKELKQVAEGAFIPQTSIRLNDNLVRLHKRGRMLAASYEAIKFQRLDLFTVALQQIGAYIAKAQMKDAVDLLLNGDAKGQNAAKSITTSATTLAYGDLLTLWNQFEDYEMDTIIASPDMAAAILALSEFKDPQVGANFLSTGKPVTPLGARLIRSSAVPEKTLIALDSSCALEMVSAGAVSVEYDKLIDCQMERAAITSTAGFAKIFPGATVALKVKGA